MMILYPQQVYYLNLVLCFTESKRCKTQEPISEAESQARRKVRRKQPIQSEVLPSGTKMLQFEIAIPVS